MGPGLNRIVLARPTLLSRSSPAAGYSIHLPITGASPAAAGLHLPALRLSLSLGLRLSLL